MNLTDTEYPYFQALLFSEILGIFIAVLVVCIDCYLILKVRQFHRNVIGLIGNMALIFFVLVICRLAQIGASSLDSKMGKIKNG
jgi:hypothetical protein